jgi:ribonuclease G
VRIEEVGRTSAVARLIDVPVAGAGTQNGAGQDQTDEDVLESTERRRGRRGGRRRSTAKAGATAAAGEPSSKD